MAQSAGVECSASRRRGWPGWMALIRAHYRRRHHEVTLVPLHDVAVDAAGEWSSLGEDPRFSISVAGKPLPVGWCWAEFLIPSDGRVLHPQLHVRGGDGTNAIIDLPLMGPGWNRVLLRLPDSVSALRLDPQTRAGPIALTSVRFQSVGKLQLFHDLVRHDLRGAWALWRQTRSLARTKVDLVLQQDRRVQRSATDWFRLYRKGFDPKTIGWRGERKIAAVLIAKDADLKRVGAAVASVQAQTYPHWELICVDVGLTDARTRLEAITAGDPRISVHRAAEGASIFDAARIGLDAASGPLLIFVSPNEVLETHAFARLADADFETGADLFYADEVTIGSSDEEIIGLQARSAFSHDEKMSEPGFAWPRAVRTDVARELGSLRQSTAPVREQEHALFLKLLEHAATVTHIPDVLSRHQVAPPPSRAPALDGALARLKTAHLRRLGFPEATVISETPASFTVRYHRAPAGRVLGIVPTKNRYSMLRRCLETVRDTAPGIDLDLVVVDHQSTEQAVRDYLQSLMASGEARVVPFAGPFNYSRINNVAASLHGADYDFLLFMNNDLEAREPGWLAAMMDLAMRADVGAVGATLLYPDGRVQHAGVVVGMQGTAEHAYKFEPFAQGGRGAPVHATREFSAVTAACMLVSRPAFDAVGGFDESLAVGFNDVDLCLRLRARGLRVLNCGEAVLIHHESASRGKTLDGADPHPEDSALFSKRYRDLLTHGDPFFSPLLDPGSYGFVPSPAARVPTAADICYRTVRHVHPVRGSLDRR